MSSLMAPLLCGATIPAVENGIGGFRGYFEVVVEGQTVEVTLEAEGVSDDGRIAMEAKDFASYVIPLSPDRDSYKPIALDGYSFSVQQISNKGVVTGKASGKEGNTKKSLYLVPGNRGRILRCRYLKRHFCPGERGRLHPPRRKEYSRRR